MRGSRSAGLLVLAVFATLLVWSGASPAAAGPAIAYAGRGIAITETISGTTTRFADTGELASTGGSREASSLTGGTASAAGEVLHAGTVGQGDRTRSEASVDRVSLNVAGHTVAAEFVMSRASAIKHGASVQLSAQSHVESLVVNGLPVPVTGQPNQTVPLPDGVLVVNEQSTSSSGGIQSITVHGLHLTVGGADTVFATSKAGVSTGSNSCSGQQDAATGGGWTGASASFKRSIGFVGALRANGTRHGHLVFVDRIDDERVTGVVDTYGPGAEPTSRVMSGPAEFNGQPAGRFTLTVTDAGEPGTSDLFTLQHPGGEDGGLLVGGNIQVHQMCR